MKIGVIGTGAMGGGMVVNLLTRGYEVHLRDIDPSREAPLIERGGIRQPDPATLTARVDAVLVVVETAAQIDAVLGGEHGLLAALNSAAHADQPTAVFLCSTIAPEDTIRFATAIEQAGGVAIDAPISGGPVRAADGTMSIMLAADAGQLERLDPLLKDLAVSRFVVSATPGDGARAKLANNLAAGAYLAAASEAMSLAVSMGLDPEKMRHLMAASSGQSWIGDDRLPRGLAGLMPAVGAATRVLTKDLTLAVQAANTKGAPVPLGQAALERFEQACAQQMSDCDDSSLYTLYRQQTPGS